MRSPTSGSQLTEEVKAQLGGKPLSFYVLLLDVAHYLGIDSFRWALSQYIAEQMKGKSVE